VRSELRYYNYVFVVKKSEKTILWFDEVSKGDVPLVGGKAANLGEMLKAGIPVPSGFIVSAAAYFDFVKKTSLKAKLKAELRGLDVHNSKKLRRASRRIQAAIKAAKMPASTAKEIKEAYLKLSGTHDELVAVRSSATAEDLPDASFAGQMQTFLNVEGTTKLLKAVQGCWASLFTARAIFYRQEKNFNHFQIGIAVPVQKMVDSKVSGVLFTVDPLTSNPNLIAIEAAYGLGETVVAGELTPDQYLVNKKNFQIVDKKIVLQSFKITRGGRKKVPRRRGSKQKLADKKIIELAKIAQKIEEHYGDFPQDVEWGYAKNAKIWIVQTRPVTTLDVQGSKFEVREDVVDEKLLLEGAGASPGVAVGPVRIIPSAKQIDKVKKGDILVTEMTNPDFVPAMKRAAAIVTDKGGRTSHAAIVSRELSIPCVVGTGQATAMLKSGETVTVDGSSGKVYQGSVSSEEMSPVTDYQLPITDLKTATKLYVNLSEPEAAAGISTQNVDGVGLLRSEFLIAGIGVHPRKLIDQGKSKIFVDQLVEGVGRFCRAFSPRPIVYRASDLKTSEYRNLEGGKKYEAEEGNPFLGFRGARRYIVDDDVFRLELKALKRVKNKMDFRNLVLMIPFVRTPEELEKVKRIVGEEGLRRSPRFKLWMMVEIPSNVVILEEFAEVGIDGVSIGSNDLTMLTLGVDRDNAKIAEDFDERDPAVLWMLEQTIKKCQKLGLTSSICGQAPSDFPKLTKKLVEWGITSISVNPDVIPQTRQIIYEAEKGLVS